MYDYFDYGMGYSLISDLIAGIGMVSLIVGILTVMISGLYFAAQFVASAVIFMKAGEKPWKVLIPVYDMYTYFKLCEKPKMFTPWLITFIGIFVGNIIMLCATLYYSEGARTILLIGLIITVICVVASLVIYILLCNYISKSFNKGAGFTVGLVLLSTIFRMVLAFGKAEYAYKDAEQTEEYSIKEYPKGYLECLSGDRSGARIEMGNGDIVTIGRDPNLVNFVVDRNTEGSKVSRKHCEIQYFGEHGVFYVTDFSSNGVKFEDGTTILSGVKTPLKKGTVIILPKDIRFIVR